MANLRIFLLAPFWFLLSSCGALAYQVTILRANHAFQRAQEAGAEEHAPYHYYRAQAYLEKAREEAGYADFQPALRYGRVALKSAKEALQRIQEGGGRGPDGAQTE